MASSLVNLLLMEVTSIVSIVLLAILIVLSSYRRRSGHPALRLFVWAASTLFLPLVSYAVSAAAKWDATHVPLLLPLSADVGPVASEASRKPNRPVPSEHGPCLPQVLRLLPRTYKFSPLLVCLGALSQSRSSAKP